MFNQKLKYCYYHVILNLTFFLPFNIKDGVLYKKGKCIKTGAVKIQKLTREGILIFFQEKKSTLLGVPPKNRYFFHHCFSFVFWEYESFILIVQILMSRSISFDANISACCYTQTLCCTNQTVFIQNELDSHSYSSALVSQGETFCEKQENCWIVQRGLFLIDPTVPMSKEWGPGKFFACT